MDPSAAIDIQRLTFRVINIMGRESMRMNGLKSCHENKLQGTNYCGEEEGGGSATECDPGSWL